MARGQIAVSSVFRNEARTIEEWLTHYLNQGIDHFFLFDLGSTDSVGSVLSPFVRAGYVSLLNAPELRSSRERQVAANNYCLRNGGRKFQWLCFLDTDEFLFSPARTNVREALAELSNLKAIFVPWVIFGSSNLAHPKECGVVESFTNRAASIENPMLSKIQHNRISEKYDVRISGHPIQGKTLVKPAYVKSMRIHWPGEGYMKYLRNEMGQPVDESFLHSLYPEPSFEFLRINHYWLRGKESPKIAPENVEWGTINSRQAVLAWDEYANQKEDFLLRDKNRSGKKL